MPDIYLIQAGAAPHDVRAAVGDIPDWFRQALPDLDCSLVIVPAFQGAPLPSPDPDAVAIITGSWAMVTDLHPWSEAIAQWIREAMSVAMALFGVCYGHQLMAHALGGRVGYHPKGSEIGCKTVQLHPEAAGDHLLSGWPQQFAAHLTHLQTVIALPEGARVLASTAHDPHQIIRYGPRAISTQFHPEFTVNTASACIRRRASLLEDDCMDAATLLNGLVDTPEARRLLRHFIDVNLKTSPSALALITGDKT